MLRNYIQQSLKSIKYSNQIFSINSKNSFNNIITKKFSFNKMNSNLPRLYSDINKNKPTDYSNYENLEIQWG